MTQIERTDTDQLGARTIPWAPSISPVGIGGERRRGGERDQPWCGHLDKTAFYCSWYSYRDLMWKQSLYYQQLQDLPIYQETSPPTYQSTNDSNIWVSPCQYTFVPSRSPMKEFFLPPQSSHSTLLYRLQCEMLGEPIMHFTKVFARTSCYLLDLISSLESIISWKDYGEIKQLSPRWSNDNVSYLHGIIPTIFTAVNTMSPI